MMANMSMSVLSSMDLVDSLQHAGVAMDQALATDRSYLDLSDLLQIGQHNHPTASGHLDFDYPSLEDPRIGLSSISEIGHVKKIPLPSELVEQFGRMQCNCSMGLFPEINRAWLAIDNDIFVWNYEEGSDVSYFDGLSETILCAGLVRPKPGIFRPHIQYLLCLATPVDIVLLGVSFTSPEDGAQTGGSVFNEMYLLPEPLFSIPTDNIHVLSIQGADNGRIFMAAKDGCLYETHYQAEDGWFSRKCRKINHSKGKFSMVMMPLYYFSSADDAAIVQISIDNSRNILYTRSEKGTIQVYDMGEDGTGMSRVASISQDTMAQNAALVARGVDRNNFKPIVHIAAIPREESINIHLVVITHTGVRLYFSTTPFGDRGRPSMLALVHTRLSPGHAARAAPNRPTKVHTAHYRKGTLLLAASQSEENDLIWTIASDSFPFKKQLQETHERTAVDGRAWAISEVPEDLLGSTPLSYGAGLKADPPAVVTQHMQPNRKFVIINSQGSYLLTKQNPSDQLRQLLVNFGADSEEVESYFRLHQEQAFSTCLLLACSQVITEQQVAELATRAFFRFGGDPKYNFDAALGGTAAATHGSNLATSFAPGSTSMMLQSPGPNLQPTVASTPFPHAAHQLSFQTPASPLNQTATSGSEVIFSNRFKGLCLYLARILRPMWDFRMVEEYPVVGQPGVTHFLASRYNSSDLGWILGKLQDLKAFVDKNSQFASALVAEGFAHTLERSPRNRMTSFHRTSDGDEQAQRRFQAEADAQENTSLKTLQQLINISSEALGLWQLLCNHQFHTIAQKLSKDQQNTLRHLSFRQFVTQGKEMAQCLITSLIGMYIEDNAATDSISTRLREVCPSFYSFEDQIYSKGNEKFKTATTQQSKMDREKLLNEALEKYKQITTQLDLPIVCKQFASVHFYRGIVDLALTSAATRDPQGNALHYYENGEPVEDSQGMYAYRMRMDCYKCITETLDYLLSTSLAHPHSPSVPSSPGPPPAADPNRLTTQEADVYVEEMFTLALKSQDQMFHMALYDWLVMKKLTEKLLTVQSPYLEPYLKRKAQLQPDSLQTLDLLWKHYEKTKNFAAASRILTKLADKQGVDMTLHQRMEYLSRAIMCAKGSTQTTRATSEGEFLHQLEDKMEVARLQLQVYEALQRVREASGVEDALCSLNGQLQDITALYGEFSERFDLSECKLAIVHCAGHYDPTMVEALWQDIITKELQTSTAQDARTRMNSVNQKFVGLGRVYASSEKYFPIAFLIKFLEQLSCEINFDHEELSFVFRMLLETGVSLPRLHEMYDRLFKSKDFCWKKLGKPFHLLRVIEKLLSTFVDSPTTVSSHDRRPFTNTALDSIAFYLVELQSDGTSTDIVRSLILQFRDLQARLERFV